MARRYPTLFALALTLAPVPGTAGGLDLSTLGFPGDTRVESVRQEGSALRVSLSANAGGFVTEARLEALNNALREAYPEARSISVTSGGKPLWQYLPPVPSIPPQTSEPSTEGAVTGALTGRTIVLSPGHGYYASSSTAWSLQRGYWYGIVEDFMNQEIIQNVYNLLVNNGATVYVTREMDKTAGNCATVFTFADFTRSAPNLPWWQMAALYYVQKVGAPLSVSDNGRSGDYNRDIAARPLYANWRNADILVSLHNNATSSHTARGTTTLYDTSNGYANKDKNGNTGANVGSLPLATKLQNRIVSLMRANYYSSWRDLGLLASDGGYGENRIATRPAALIEAAFFDEPNDNAALQDENWRLLLAKAIYLGICDYFNVTPTYNTNVQGTAGTWGARPISPVWSLKLPSKADAAPASADGWVYAATSGGVVLGIPALASTGFTPGVARWTQPLGAAVKARPAVYGDSLYVATAAGKVVALNRATGGVRWSTMVASSGGLSASPCPTPDGGLVVASDNGRVYLLRQSDGSLVQSFPAAGSLGTIIGTPAVPSGLGVWVTSASGAVRLLSPDLTTIRWEAATGSPITTSPFVSSDSGLVFVTGGNNVVYAWNAATGNPAPGWLGSGINLGGPSRSSPWAANGWVAAGRDDHALAGLLVSGAGYAPGLPLKPFGVREFPSPPVVVNDTIYIGGADGRFYALRRTAGSGDPAAGWRVFDSATVGLPGQFLTAACVTGPTADDRVIAAATNGYLYAFPLNP